jgi:uncharacterized protein (DUF1800 family)
MTIRRILPLYAFLSVAGNLLAGSPSPSVTGLSVSNGQPVVHFTPAAGAVEYRALHAPALGQPFAPVTGSVDGFLWSGGNISGPSGFYRIEARQFTPQEQAITTLLNRIAYGPTPDELPRVRALGADAYITEQLAPETIQQDLDAPPAGGPVWRRITVSGRGTASRFDIYLTGAGSAYVDNFRLVRGDVDDGSQTNLLANGNFESPLAGSWVLPANFATSARSTENVQNGGAALHLVASAAGGGGGNSVNQTVTPALSSSQTYTLTFWYLLTGENNRLVVRLSGDGIRVEESLSGSTDSPAPLFARLNEGRGQISDLRAWHLQHAIQSHRQLLEVTRQFVENHFVTEYNKSREYFDMVGLDDTDRNEAATRMEFKENIKWRDVLLRPQGTFYDLLKISAESPAMIIYLDTVRSRGDRSGSNQRVANENYARELCELFCFGVDNGYDQGDIVQLSRAWTGWSVEYLSLADQNNPFATRSTVYRDPAATNLNSLTNLIGDWTLRYRMDRHDNRVKFVFYNKDANGGILTNSPKTVPARFGAPWAGRSYGLRLDNSPGGTNATVSMQDGYQVIRHMADQPFTQEYLSVKLCRLLVHDNFRHGYDFTDADTSPEEELVKACMLAWENPPGGGPKGQIRPVLRTILNSTLFRSCLVNGSKVKTPLEFAASTVRAFRARRADGSHTAVADAANMVSTDSGVSGVLNRAGRMRLFDRAEPDGYGEDGASWISAGTLTERIRFCQSMALAGAGLPTDAGLRSPDNMGSSRVFPSALLAEKLPAGQRDAGAVSQFFLDLLFSGEGSANLGELRTISERFLNTADDGTTASPFAALAPNSRDYDARLRGLVAFLMSTQRFQEQ